MVITRDINTIKLDLVRETEITLMNFWIKFFMDKRFSWDFKIANLMMGDSLRNYLAVDLITLGEIEDIRARKIEKDIEILFNRKGCDKYGKRVNQRTF